MTTFNKTEQSLFEALLRRWYFSPVIMYSEKFLCCDLDFLTWFYCVINLWHLVSTMVYVRPKQLARCIHFPLLFRRLNWGCCSWCQDRFNQSCFLCIRSVRGTMLRWILLSTGWRASYITVSKLHLLPSARKGRAGIFTWRNRVILQRTEGGGIPCPLLCKGFRAIISGVKSTRIYNLQMGLG